MTPATEGLRLRPMAVDDLDAVLAVEGASYAFPWTRGNFIDSLAAGYRCELAQAPDGGVAGYTVAMFAVDEVHLLNITVDPAHQGRGHGRALLEQLVQHAARRGLHSLWLEVRPSNRRAIDLYLRRGFREVGLRRGYYPAPHGRREDAIVMSLALPETVPHALD